MIELALSLVEPRTLKTLLEAGRPTVARCGEVLNWSARPFLAEWADRTVDRLHFGSEFCETLLPGESQLRQAVEAATAGGIRLSLVTAPASDAGLRQIATLIELLPPGSEVIANDWGVLRLLRDFRPALAPVAGRILCKMVKDPRLPSPEWAKLYPHGVHSRYFAAMLTRLGVKRIEMDVPPFAEPGDFHGLGPAISVHSPFGFSVRGRSCRPGSLNLPPERKFTVAPSCRRECLVYIDRMSRREGASERDLPTFQRGHTMFYRHSPEMSAALATAVAQGRVDRVILSGDWNEDCRSHQSSR